MILTFVVLALTVAIQIVMLRRLDPASLVGDEAEYAGQLDPAKAPPWIRVPLHRDMMKLAASLTPANPALSARLLVAVQSVAVVTLATGFAEATLSPWSAAIVAALLLFSVERAILACHLWPDIAMGGYWLLAAILIPEPTFPSTLALAGIAGLALGTRIEGAALALLSVAVPVVSGHWLWAVGAVLILAGFVLTFLLWNRLAQGRWQLDTTIGFNVAVARIDAASPANSIEDTMRATVAHIGGPSGTRLPQARAATHAGRIAARIRLLFGPESFVSQNLIGSGKARYRDAFSLGPASTANLAHWFTLCVGLCALALPFAAPERVALLGFASLVYLALLVRSRYRMALLPMMSLIVAEGAYGATHAAPASWPWLGPISVLALIAILRFAPKLAETTRSV